jgi:S-adenosyl-L-methionine hydrolase (adenosine-forming)
MFITLTTDLGNRDWYAGALKGAALCAAPDAQLVDISHEIRPFDIVQAALVLRNVWSEFPTGTIHLVAVNCTYHTDARFVAIQRAGHVFFAPDNGVLTLLFDDIQAGEARLLTSDEAAAGGEAAGLQHFGVKKMFAAGLAHLAKGEGFDSLGVQIEDSLLERIQFRPVLTARHIRATVVHVDHFDNVILNLDRATFEQVRQGRGFALYFKRNDPLTVLSHNYSDVPLGEPLCLFNSADLLEIAVNFGQAATLFGLKQEDVVEVVFE